MNSNSNAQRIYLDNAATSWPKPESVYRQVDQYLRECGASAGRSAYREASEVERLISDTRNRLGRFINAPPARPIVFTCNGTEALNLALHGILRPHDHVVTTVTEHNSVLRPLQSLQEQRAIDVTLVPCDSQGIVHPDEIRRAIRPRTKLVALIHVSNVTGAVQPIAEVGAIAREYGLLFLVDAAQSIGHVPIDVQACHIDLLAAPGHKGLLGPLGIGFLYANPKIADQLHPLRQGGTGTRSDSDQHPVMVPEGLEAGNLNVPGIVGLRAGLMFLEEQSPDALRQHEQALIDRLMGGLSALPGVTIVGPKKPCDRLGVVSIMVAGYDPQEVALMLDASHSIQVRSGLHCAARIHAALGTLAGGGTVRFSTGPFNTLEQMDATIDAVGEISASSLSL